MLGNKQANRLAKECVDSAKKMLGPGWKHVGPQIRVALVRNHAWHIITGQDESIPSQTVRELVEDLDDELEVILETKKEFNE